MRLLTQNFLACLKCESYPLAIEAVEVSPIAVEYDAEFTRRMLARIDYPSLVTAYHGLRNAHEAVRAESSELPETMPESGEDLTNDDSDFLHTLHYALNVVAVKSGQLKCTACGTEYAVNDFIPNFIVEKK